MKLERETEFPDRSVCAPSVHTQDPAVSAALARAGIPELRAYRNALDCAAIVATTDLRGRITDVNPQFCSISEYNREELVGASHRIVNSGYHDAAFFRELWTTIASGQVWRGDIRNRAKSGAHYWVDTTIAPLKTPDGKLLGYVSIRFDITDRKVTEARLLEELERRQTAEDLLRDIMEAVRHFRCRRPVPV